MSGHVQPVEDPFSGFGLFESVRDYITSVRFAEVWDSQSDRLTAVRVIYFMSLNLTNAPINAVVSWCDQSIQFASYLEGKYKARLEATEKRLKTEVSQRRASAMQALVLPLTIEGISKSRLPEISKKDVVEYIEMLPEVAPIVTRETVTRELVEILSGMYEACKRRHASAVQVSVNERHEVDDATR